MCIPLRSRNTVAPPCASHRRVKLRSVLPTVESCSAVCFLLYLRVKLLGVLPPGETKVPTFSKTPQCASHCGVKLRGVLPTEEYSSEVCFLPRSQAPGCASYSGVKLRSVHINSIYENRISFPYTSFS